MTTLEISNLFKCLADPSRLLILQSLGKEDMYVERLAERLGLTPPTVSFHLKKLEDAGAVRSRKEQYYTVYSLCPDVFSPRIIDLIQKEGCDPLEEKREEAYRQKTLSTFMLNGKITKMPAQLKKKLILIEEICHGFEAERPYTEKEMNLMIADYYDDFCMVRRFFVDYGLFTRDNGVYFKQRERILSLKKPLAR